MTILSALLLLLLLAFSACIYQTVNRSASHPEGSGVGTSFPGVNQPTSSTTATSSNDSR